MRTKSLLVGAVSPFLGPWVHLEAGEWMLDYQGDNKLEFWVSKNSTLTTLDPEEVSQPIFGPVKVRINLLEGQSVYVSAQQVANA